MSGSNGDTGPIGTAGSESPADGPPVTPPPGGRRIDTHVFVLAGLLVLALLAVLILWRRSDPFSVGTSHHAKVQLNECHAPTQLAFDDPDGNTGHWVRDFRGSNDNPPSWPRFGVNAPAQPSFLTGTLLIADRDDGIFTADIGGSMPFHRLAEGKFSSQSCDIP